MIRVVSQTSITLRLAKPEISEQLLPILRAGFSAKGLAEIPATAKIRVESESGWPDSPQQIVIEWEAP